MTAKNDATGPDARAVHWGKEIERAKKRWRTFWEAGDVVVDSYRLQKSDGNEAASKDKYNILYSSTETIRPNLYGQEPKTRVTLRNKDQASDTARAGSLLLEGCLEYVKQAEDFDDLMDSATEDFLLPGLGTAWVRYEANFGDKTDDAGNPIPVEGGKKDEYQQELLDEMAKCEYVYWQDFLMGICRSWKQAPWVAKRLWLTKADATKRFGTDKANSLKYMERDTIGRDMDNPSETAEAWEIWDKVTKTVYWWAEGVADLLDTKPDPLKLKDFFPCPRPMRAISNTRSFVPRSLYSQYKSQAETLNVMTKRIRLLSEALRVVGLYDGSQVKLNDILNPTAGNRMIAVDNWAMFAQNGGINGVVMWLPIDQIVKVLAELLKAREICKAEIYEITGLSDIIRGVSKASETLGAQNIKSNWASSRVKKMQKEVQRFARDIISLLGEIIAEHCAPETIAIFSGLEIPTGEQVQADPAVQAKVKLFTDACAFIKNEARRVSSIDIETDSTLMVDDAQDKTDRAQFLAAAGAFLQQAVPAMEATPELGPLLGAMLMFTVRSFPSARIMEDEFENVQKAMASRAQQPQDTDKDGKKAAAAAAAQKTQQDGQIRQQELAQKGQAEAAKNQRELQAEQNRHNEKMAEIALRNRELAYKESELTLKQGDLAIAWEVANTAKFVAVHAAALAELGKGLEMAVQVQEDQREYDTLAHDSEENAADRAHEAGQADADRAHEATQADADREAQAEAAEAAEGPEGPAGGEGGSEAS